MSKPIFIYSDELQKYHFHSNHPFNQKRLLLTLDLLETMNAIKPTQIISPRYATEDELLLFHTKEYIEAVKLASKGTKNIDFQSFGLDTEDVPIFNNMHQASSYLVGGTLVAAEAVLTNQTKCAVFLGGGLHHGHYNRASGFCVYNDIAVAIKYIQKHYKARVLYIDTDAHHGDGVQWAFYDDNSVCTYSIHETGRYLFPGTGNVAEKGTGEGYGYSFNIPLDAFTEDESFIESFETSIRTVAEYFKPDIIISQNGADAHYLDPLTHLSATMNIYKTIPTIIKEIAEQYCDGKMIVLGGGGYDIYRVVPRAWSILWLVLNDLNLTDEFLPIEWIQKWQREIDYDLPTTWFDSQPTYNPIPRKADITEKNKQAVRKAIQSIRNSNNFSPIN